MASALRYTWYKLPAFLKICMWLHHNNSVRPTVAMCFANAVRKYLSSNIIFFVDIGSEKANLLVRKNDLHVSRKSYKLL